MDPTLRERLAHQLAFLNEVEKLKVVYRRNRTVDRARFENSAEHSWHVALMALVLAEHADAPSVDIHRVVQLLLVHDLVEIDAGDTWLYDTEAVAGQAEREARAADRLFALLPQDQAAHFHDLRQEFDAGATAEAAFARALDGLQPLMNHLLTGEPDPPEVTLAESRVLRRKQHIADSSQALWAAAQAIVETSTERGLYLQDLDAVEDTGPD